MLGGVPLSWIRGSTVWILSSSSSLTLPSLLAWILSSVLTFDSSLHVSLKLLSLRFLNPSLFFPPLGSFPSYQFYFSWNRPSLLGFFPSVLPWINPFLRLSDSSLFPFPLVFRIRLQLE